jgi:peptidylprolyl isomerase
MLQEAKPGDVVRIHYAGRLPNGKLFASSQGREPLEFTLGDGQVIPGVEKAVEGLAVGEKVTTRVPAEEAYGPRRDDLIVEVERRQFPEGAPSIGERFEMKLDDGSKLPVTVCELHEESVYVDANHPLAGKELTFDLELSKIG